MADDLKQIDISTIGELSRIREEEDRFQERLQKMETSRGKVSAAVYEKVQRDYATRLASLDAEARPLRERARAEYAKLKALQVDAEKGLQDVGLAKEELEFRKELGEFQESDFAKRLAACKQDVAERKAWVEEIGRMRDQFRKAFRSDEELEAPSAAPPPAAATPPRASESRPAAEPAKTPAPSGTIVVPTTGAALSIAADATVSAPPSSGPKAPVTTQVATAPSSQATIATPAACVVRMVDGKEEKVFSLRPDTNTIGRSPKNEIELPFTEISRRHAEISLGPEGFRIVDLNSNNGIYVNGQKVKEHLLADGDLIQIGTQSLLFRA